MTAKKPSKEKPSRVRIEDLKAEARELTEKETEKVTGGAIPSTPKPIPIPYPNIGKKD